MKLVIGLAMGLVWVFGTASFGDAADIVPTPPVPPTQEKERTPPAAERDPGMVKQPDTVPHPDSVVTPPVVDPKMAINPDEPSSEQKERQTPREAPGSGMPVPPPNPLP